ncbi:uncharacterized protein [Amphiura filiformis]|uniref:uncharacterized protein isoform X1 n=1 Tax=Amphiura filiformis TaxID=82378 RepID=UPI003B223027
MGQVIKSSSKCHIDILTDDALIIIFSFLTLYERLMVMRVSKRCHRILSNPQAWTHVDFWQQQLTRNKLTASRYSKTWIFPDDKESVLDFLKKYTSGSLKSIYLKVVSKDILTHLKKNCGNLEIISFISANDPVDSADISDFLSRNDPADTSDIYLSFPEIIPLPKTIKVCEVSWFSFAKNGEKQWENLMMCFAKCPNLRRLILHGIILTSEVCMALSASKVTELSQLSFLNMRVAGGGNHNSSQLNTALISLYNLTKITSFRMSTDDDLDSSQRWLNLNRFLCAITGKWQDLRCLSLIGIQALSCQTFALMTSALTQLQILELHGQSITDENISLIAKHLKKLTTLKLTDGIYTPIGISMLGGHPSIEKLYLLQNNQVQQSPEWLLAVYDVILSLPKITYVKLIGYRVISLHAKEQIPKVTRDVQIEVENSEIRFEEIEETVLRQEQVLLD